MKVNKVLICDDHAVVRAGLHLILSQEKDFEIVGEAENAEQALEQTARHRPDIVVMDISMPGANGLDAIPRLRAVAPQCRVLVLTVHDDPAYFFQALRAGAAGYLLKGAATSELLAALRLVLQGGVPIPSTLAPQLLNDYMRRVDANALSSYDALSPREHAVVQLICRGRTNKQIAEELSLSVRTVERYRASIMHKAGLQNRAELVAYAVRQGLLSGSEARLK